jgi:GGDEF domain-containing protein
VILLDVARMRVINEVLGFETGDALLARLAGRLRELVAEAQPGDAPPILARLEGGMFAIACVGRDRPALQALRARIDDSLSGALEFGGHAVDVNLVFGLADDATSADQPVERLLRNAAQATSAIPPAWS